MDANYLAQSVVILLEGRGKQVRLGLGTHDVDLIEQIAVYADAAGIGRDAYEVQMLYGIRVDQQKRLAEADYRVRALIAYGEFWYPWYIRRLAERRPTSPSSCVSSCPGKDGSRPTLELLEDDLIWIWSLPASSHL